MNNTTSKKITYTGIMIALVFLGTFVLKIPTPFTNGYIHLGDAFVFLSGVILGPLYGALAAGIGSALADLLGGYGQWVLPTFIIKALMAAIIGFLASKKDNRKVILLISGLFSVAWVGFNLLMRFILSSQITENSTELIPDVAGITTISELTNLSSQVQNKLIFIALLVPIVMTIILLIFRKFSSTKFSLAYSSGFIIAGSFMVVAYYLASSMMYGSYIVPILDIPANIVQFLAGVLIAHLLLPFAQKITPAKI
ncbi:MAG: ECF transporter S component [Vallitaleaceae bacterium]|nr:ECF transporter S component [Vallitaleaceae bacterium]